MKILNLRSIFTLILSLTIFAGFHVSTNTALAANVDESDKIKSIIKNGALSKEKAIVVSSCGTTFEVDIYETEEKLISEDLSTKTKSYVKEYAVVWDNNDTEKQNRNSETDSEMMQPLGSKNEDEWDKTGGVQGFVTVYYDRNGSLYKVTRATGYWENHDGGMTTLSNRKYIIACNDLWIHDQFILDSISTTSFNRYTGFTKYADGNIGMAAVGCNSKVTINRGGYSWTLLVPCALAGQMPTF